MPIIRFLLAKLVEVLEETSFTLTIKPMFLKYIFGTHLCLFQEKHIVRKRSEDIHKLFSSRF